MARCLSTRITYALNYTVGARRIDFYFGLSYSCIVLESYIGILHTAPVILSTCVQNYVGSPDLQLKRTCHRHSEQLLPLHLNVQAMTSLKKRRCVVKIMGFAKA